MSAPLFSGSGKCPTPRFREGKMSGGKCPGANGLHSGNLFPRTFAPEHFPRTFSPPENEEQKGRKFAPSLQKEGGHLLHFKKKGRTFALPKNDICPLVPVRYPNLYTFSIYESSQDSTMMSHVIQTKTCLPSGIKVDILHQLDWHS